MLKLLPMRRALLGLPLLFAAGCLIDSPSGDDTYYPPPDNSGWGSGYGGGGGSTDFGCHVDTDCGSNLVCARDGECLAASAVRIIHVNWTMNGQATSDTTCAHAPSLAVTFSDPNTEMFGFAPVPCNAGRYTIDKFPSRFDTVQLTRESEYSGGASTRFDAMGNATLDLKY
jgi:hypothetical protein